MERQEGLRSWVVETCVFTKSGPYFQLGHKILTISTLASLKVSAFAEIYNSIIIIVFLSTCHIHKVSHTYIILSTKPNMYWSLKTPTPTTNSSLVTRINYIGVITWDSSILSTRNKEGEPFRYSAQLSQSK